MAAEDAIDNLGRETFPAIYGDIAIINDRTQIAVYLTTLSPQIQGAFEAVAPPNSLVFRTTPRSAQNLNRLHKVVEGYADGLIADGIRLAEIGPNILLGKEDIGIVNITPDQVTTLDKMFGADAINVYNITSEEFAKVASLANRLDDPDAPPYNGGAAVRSNTSGCTTGYGIRISNTRRLVSAGHCFSVGDDVVNAKGTDGSFAPMGTVTQNGLTFHSPAGFYEGVDTLVLSDGGNDRIFRGPIGSSYEDIVDGKGSWHVGDNVCESGAYGGELCGLSVEQINYDIWADQNFRHYYHVTRIHSSGSNAIGGDSGAPVFRVSGGVQGVGTLTALAGNGDAWFTGINAILDQWGACLQTSGGCVS